jgi:hypothetical protein
MGDLRGNLGALVAALAAGKTVQEAASLAEMGVATAYRRLQDSTVQQKVRATRAAMFERAVGALADALTAAVATLVQSLDAENEAVRVRAATAVLDWSMKLREHADLAERIAHLEARLAAQEQEAA